MVTLISWVNALFSSPTFDLVANAKTRPIHLSHLSYVNPPFERQHFPLYSYLPFQVELEKVGEGLANEEIVCLQPFQRHPPYKLFR